MVNKPETPMHELPHRFAIMVLLLGGALTACMPALLWMPYEPAAGILVVQGQFMLSLLGTAMLVGAFVPSWRLPAAVAGALTKGAFLVIWATVPDLVQPFPGAAALEGTLLALLLVASAVFGHDAWQEARWNGMLRIRLES
jgi:hypothetical protein